MCSRQFMIASASATRPGIPFRVELLAGLDRPRHADLWRPSSEGHSRKPELEPQPGCHPGRPGREAHLRPNAAPRRLGKLRHAASRAERAHAEQYVDAEDADADEFDEPEIDLDDEGDSAA